MLGNPLQGRIQAQDEVWDGTSFRVTSTFAEHVASGRGAGIDFGNGRCGDEVYACDDGDIVAAFIDPGNGAVIVRIRHPQHGNLVTGYAHLASIEVGLVHVARGQVIGHVGATGADACHLHWGVNVDGTEVDGWPLLMQNSGDDMDPSFVAAGNRTLTLHPGARHRQAPRLNGPVQILIPNEVPLEGKVNGQTVRLPILGTVIGEAVGGNGMWYVYWQPESKNLLYIHSSAADIAEFETKVSGITQEQLSQAVIDAVTPLNKKISAAKAALA